MLYFYVDGRSLKPAVNSNKIYQCDTSLHASSDITDNILLNDALLEIT